MLSSTFLLKRKKKEKEKEHDAIMSELLFLKYISTEINLLDAGEREREKRSFIKECLEMLMDNGICVHVYFITL